MKVARTPISDPRWSDFVSLHPEATPFHLPQWASTIASCYGFDAFALTLHDSAGEIVAGTPAIAVRSLLGGTRWVSLPFSDTCSVLTRSDASAHEVTVALGEFVAAAPADLEVRAALPEGDRVHQASVGYNHVLPLPADPAELRPKKNHRNSRNRAIRNGVSVRRGNSKDDVETFYRLHTMTRRRHGVPVQPHRFFDLIWDRLISRGHGFVATAVQDDTVLASGIYLSYNGTLVAKYFASDPTQPDRRAGYLLDWEMMVAACEEGYRALDMGRSDPDADGLRLYKSSWGAEEMSLVYTHFAAAPPRQRRASSAGEVAKHVIRRSPLWVCRTLGEVFYRWSA